jgi:Tfp pilus assembly protein PilN
MKPISINLASRPFYNTRLYIVAFAASLTLLVIMTGMNLYILLQDQTSWKRFGEAQAQLQTELQSLEHQALRFERDLERLDLGAVTDQSGFANEAILQRVFSWTLLFNRLERVMPPTVKLRSLRPEVGEEGISFRVLGTAKDAKSFTDFEENLLAAAVFTDVYPVSESLSQSGQGIDFDLSFHYLSVSEEMPSADGESPPAPAAGDTTRADADSQARPEDAGEESSS